MRRTVYVVTTSVDCGEDAVVAVYADEARARAKMTPSDSVWPVDLIESSTDPENDRKPVATGPTHEGVHR